MTSGLSSTEAERLLSQYGPNALPEAKKRTFASFFFAQLKSPLIALLLVAASVMFFLHGWTDAVVTLLVVIINSILGSVQEYKAETTLRSLKHLSPSQSSVIRDGHEMTVESLFLVPGDRVILREGDKIPADGVLLKDGRLSINESILTGESLPVEKREGEKVFRGTFVQTGFAHFRVEETGGATKIGSIATAILSIHRDVPLTKKIASLSRLLLLLILSFAGLFSAVALMRGLSPLETTLTVITLVVSLIPEGLPVVLTLVLAFSVARMSKKNALIKKLQAVEALGSATVICVDKTGTLTLNELCLERCLLSPDHLYTFTGSGFSPEGNVMWKNLPLPNGDHHDIKLLFAFFLRGLTASVHQTESGTYAASGDPTEAALLVAMKKFHGKIPALHTIASDSFHYQKKYSSHLFLSDEGVYYRVRIGAPEVLLSRSKASKKDHERYEQYMREEAVLGMRLVAVSMQSGSEKDHLSDERIFALLSLQDTVREEAAPSIAAAKEAGIHVAMITGDYKETAIAIAKEVGIYQDKDPVLTGEEIERMTDEELREHLEQRVMVFARVTPEHKLRIIQALSANGEIVAMTGDGVNDAASLVAADLGIAMGKTGTETAKDAADIILLDDNFKSITAAINEGRGLYVRLRHVLTYLLSTSLGEALTIGGALILGLGVPILPVQIIWLNFITDGFLDVALAQEPRKNILQKTHLGPTQSSLIPRAAIFRIISLALTMAVGTLFVASQFSGVPIDKLHTLVLTTLAAFQWLNAWNCRSTSHSLSTLPLLGNTPLVFATLIVVILQIGAVHFPPLASFLHTTPLSFAEWVMCVGIGFTILGVDELRKAISTLRL